MKYNGHCLMYLSLKSLTNTCKKKREKENYLARQINDLFFRHCDINSSCCMIVLLSSDRTVDCFTFWR